MGAKISILPPKKGHKSGQIPVLRKPTHMVWTAVIHGAMTKFKVAFTYESVALDIGLD